MTIFNVLTLIGGLAMFLYGMNVMGNGLEKLAGGKLEKIFERHSVLLSHYSNAGGLCKRRHHEAPFRHRRYNGRKYWDYRNSVDIVFVRT